MFWKYSHQTHPQQLDYLLDKKDVTLQELLDEEDVLQECRAQNKKLIEFLIRPEIMEELVTLTTVEPTVGSGDSDTCDTPDEFTLYKYPNTACELLACDIPTLNERLAGDEALMRRLYSFLEAEPPLNPLLASFFARTLGVLLTRNSEQNWYSYQLTCLQVLEFLKSREDFVSLLLRHMGTSAIMDLMFKLFTSVEGDEMKLNLLNWLNGQQVVQRLVSLFHPSVDAERHSNTAHLLCNVISKCRDNAAQAETRPPSTNIILKVIESPQIVSNLLELILSDGPNGEKSESAIVGGILVLLDILDYNPNSRENGLGGCGGGSGHINRDGENVVAEEHKLMVGELIEALVPFLPKLHALLLDPPHKASVRTTAEVLTVPLGATRLHVAKLICALIAAHTPAVDLCLIKLNTINVLLDLFFKYTWNNFLHTQVEHAISLALDIPKSKTNNNEKLEAQEWKDDRKSSENESQIVQEVASSEPKSGTIEVEEMQHDRTSEGKNQENGDGDKTKENDSQENSLVHHLFTSCNIIQRILDAWEENKEEQAKPNGRRRGYMGHLIKIANYVAKVTIPPSDEETQESVVAPLAATGISCDKEGTRSPLTATSPTSSPSPPNSPSPPSSPAEKSKPQFFSLINPPVLDQAINEAWCTFVTSLLAQANATNNVLLGGEHPSHASPASDEAVYGGVTIRQESALQESYNAFQIQQLAPMFPENYHDEGFTDEDDTQHDAVDIVPSMVYNMSEDDLTRQTELFKQLCAEKMHLSTCTSEMYPEGSDEEDEDEDDDEARSFDRSGRGFIQPRVNISDCKRDKHSSRERHDDNGKGRGSSSDEDEDEDGGRRQRRKEIQMEVDSTDPWAALDPSSNLGLAPVAMDEAPNPWGDSSSIMGASQLSSITPSALMTSQDDAAVGWADFGSATGLGAVGGFANFEANFALSPEESSDQKDQNKNMETIQSNEEVGDNSSKGECGDGSNVIPMQPQRVPKPIGEGMSTELPEPTQVGRSEDVSVVGRDDDPAASVCASDCNSTMPEDRRLMIGSDDNANPSLGGSSKDLEERDERETRQLIDNYKFLFFSVVSSGGIGNNPGSPATTVDSSEPNLAPDSTILPASSPVPSLPAHPVSDDPQTTEAGIKLGALAAEAPVLPQPSTESPANGPV